MEGDNLSTSKPDVAPHEDSSPSLSLSLTPPLSDNKDTISEHLSSIENDRSLQELNFPGNFTLELENERISQEPKPPSLSDSFNSSFVSLNGLERFISTNMEGRNHAQSILEEILSNDQFKSNLETPEESLNIFANVDLDDKLLNSYNCGKTVNFNLTSLKNDSFDEVCKRVKDFEELIAVKDTTIAALTSELDSFRELLSNTSSLGTTTTEYKQFQEECHNKLVEYHNAIIHKDEQIEKLTNSLQQSILNREEMKQHFKTEISQLQEQLEKTSNLLKEHKCAKTEFDFDEICSKFESDLSPSQSNLFNELKLAFSQHLVTSKRALENEITNLKVKFSADKAEIEQLVANGDILALKTALDAKHSKEMEELRTYFEKKCSDLEKNYSEEVFSQQSRKMSESSSCSEAELSDFVQPGPGGDTKVDFTKKDLIKLRQTLAEITKLFGNIDDEISDEDFEFLKGEISKFEFKNLLKFDLNVLQNKYHAELEILREDFDNRVDVLNVEHENHLKSVERKFLEEIEELNRQLRGRIVTTCQQEVNSGEFEIDEVVQSYERRLQEQVTLAKIDIIAALEMQIQRLVASENLDEDWPEELLRLKARFAEKYQHEMAQLNEAHLEEIARLKEEHVKTLNGALERARRRSLRDADSLSKGELELLKERDLLKKQTLALRNLLGELIKYFTQCEDELNNTLVEELITKNFTQIEKDLESTIHEDVKRVHLTPNFNDLIELIDNSPDKDLDSIDLKSELGSCLEKLKSDANAILQLSTSFSKEKNEIPRRKSDEFTSLTRKLINETQIKNELIEKLSEAGSIIQLLETDRGALDTQLEELLERQKILESDLLTAREKIAELIENGHKEIVSEGYGEDGERTVRGLAEVVAALSTLQEKARGLVENPKGLDANVVQLVEDLARVGDKIVDEARREREDLKQQVEHLEQQLRDMSKELEVSERKWKEIDGERQEAVEKIYELRDIIRDLEEQLRVKTVTEDELKSIVNAFEVIVKNQASEERGKGEGDVREFHKYIGDLESEVQRLRLSSEIAGSEGALKQIKNQLCDFETTLDKRTKDLEGLHSTISTTCSSPSEDMSIQDRSIYDECEIPLQQLARLKEKLLRHSRAEDAAVKRIRDLEMQIVSLKNELEESQNEREILKKQISDHLVLISNLQIRLDEQRIRAEHIEKQTNTSLEVQNYDLKNTIANLEEKIVKRDKTIQQLKLNIEATKKRLEDREKEILANKEDELIIQMQEELEFSKSENLKLKSKLSESEKQLELYNSLNLDKNEIESLNRLLLSGISINDLENNEQCRKTKDNTIFASPIIEKQVDKTVLFEPEISRIEKTGPHLFHSLQLSQNKANSTEKHVRFEDEIDLVEKNNVIRDYEQRLDNVEKLLVEKNDIIRDYEQRLEQLNDLEKLLVEKNDVIKDYEQRLEQLNDLEKLLVEKNDVIKDYEQRLEQLKQLQAKVEQLQASLEETEASLMKVTTVFEEETKKSKEIGAKFETKVKEFDLCKNELEDERRKSEVRDKELKTLYKVNNELKNRLKELQDEITKLVKEKEENANELLHLQQLLAQKEKIIAQMEADSKSLHINLETIQNKLQETGNVVDLGRRLREEQKKNSELYSELHSLKAQLLGAENKTIEDITSEIERELNYSAYLDASLISSLENDDLEALKLSLRKQKSVNKQLVRSREATERKFEELEKKYEELANELERVQYQDAVLIGQLRAKLNETLDNEEVYHKKLRIGEVEKLELEEKLKLMKVKVGQAKSLPVIKTEFTGLEELGLKREIRELREDLGGKIQKIVELEAQIMGFERNERVLRESLEKVRTELEGKINELVASKVLLEQTKSEVRKLKQKPKSSDPVPDQLMEKIKELNNVVRDNKQMMDLIARLNNEKHVLEERILALEDHNHYLPFDDPSERANYLFAKYLRSESYRKALTWQKQYLMSLLEPCITQKVEKTVQKKRFKHVAIMVVSICRMKYLVKRWHSGKRITRKKSSPPVQFQLGQPVSSQNFAPSALNQSKSETSWIGTSPPTKDTQMFKLSSNRDTLRSPALLTKYIERFNQIQDKLGLDTVQ